MKLNRPLQLEILKVLAKIYGFPYPHDQALWPRNRLLALTDDRDELIVNLLYLGEHKLIEHHLTFYQEGGFDWRMLEPTITKDGIDFLADDGGLGAMLNVVTFKLHVDSLRQIFEAHLQPMAAPPSERKGILETIRGLPSKSIEQLTLVLLEKGVAQLPQQLPELSKWLQAFLR
ncbi:hypothetical protein [Chitiniphilus eburneus]|uniref:hypothetical protein n=1 Tax=Chitiniphilus eburneus TaxID=2571148 RepID=UPI0035D016A7